MLSNLRVALMPACEPLEGLDGRVIHQALRTDLIPEKCKVHEADNRVTLGFALGQNEYAVSLRRRGHWDLNRIARALENALNNGNLIPGAEPFDLDGYVDSQV